jgi:hypothetical protein
MKNRIAFLVTLFLTLTAIVAIGQEATASREVLQLRLEVAQRDKVIANLQYKQAPCDFKNADEAASAAQKALVDLDKAEKEKASAKAQPPAEKKKSN